MTTETYDIDDLAPWDDKQQGKGKSKGAEQQNQKDDKQQGKDQGKEGDEKEGDKGQGQGKTPTSKEMDDAHKRIEKAFQNRKERSAEEGEPQITRQKSPPGEPGTEDMGDLQNIADEFKNIKPRSWKTLLKQMLQSASPAYDTSYMKPSRRNISGVEIARQRGAAAVKPGIKQLEEPVLKVCLCLDTSGSMGHAMPQILAETNAICKQLNKQSQPISVVFWAGNHVWYQINLKNNTYAKVSNINELNTPIKKNVQKNYSDLLSSHSSGGTEFTPQLSQELGVLATDGWNIMIFSDTDITWPGSENARNFISLWTPHKRKIFFVAKDMQSLVEARQRVGQVPANWTHLNT